MYKLKELRKKLDMTQTELAEALGGDDEGWYFQRIQRLERGAMDPQKGTQMTVREAKEICRKLKVPLSELLPDSENELAEMVNDLALHEQEIVETFVRSLLEKQNSGKRGN